MDHGSSTHTHTHTHMKSSPNIICINVADWINTIFRCARVSNIYMNHSPTGLLYISTTLRFLTIFFFLLSVFQFSSFARRMCVGVCVCMIVCVWFRWNYAIRLFSILFSNVCLQLNLLKCNQTIFLNTNGSIWMLYSLFLLLRKPFISVASCLYIVSFFLFNRMSCRNGCQWFWKKKHQFIARTRSNPYGDSKPSTISSFRVSKWKRTNWNHRHVFRVHILILYIVQCTTNHVSYKT